ncbi:zf-CCHC domain-containing protein [Tanacetum coccineum]
MAEWKEVVQACPDRKEKGWKTIYGLIKTRMEYLVQTEKELKINFNKPLKEQDPLNELNELANKKRKRTSDSTDHSRSAKKHKSSVQHEEEKVYKVGKRLLYVKRNKAISLGKGASKIGREVQQLSLKDCTWVKSIALKAKKEYSDDETLTSGSDDEEYAMAKGKSDRKCFRCGDLNHLIGDCPKPPRNKDQKAFIGGSWNDRENEAEDKINNETCLMAQSSNEVTLDSSHYNDNASSLDDDSMQIEYDNLCEIA